MRENCLRNIPSPDHETVDEIDLTELTRTNSDSSAITVESSHLNGHETPQGESLEWTNEKHNAYLDFLEASFVQQLHGSTRLGGWGSQEHIWSSFSSKELPAKPSSSSHQLMVLRDGWQKNKSEENEPFYYNVAVSSHGGLENPWKRHFTSIGEHCSETTFRPHQRSMLYVEGFPFGEDMDFSSGRAGTSEQHLDYFQNAVGSTIEVSDQNFVDEDQGDGSSFGPTAKRSRTAAADASSDDQVVPIEKLQTPNVSTVNRSSTEREEPSHHKLFSKHPDNAASPGSHTHSFLRGS